MAMDFFEAQQKAKNKTGWLILLFTLAVIAIITLIYFAVVLIYDVSFMTQQAHRTGQPPTHDQVLNWQVFFIVAGATLAVIFFASLFKIAQLAAGGKVVAESLGGRLLHHDTTDFTERKILNVVEEMAIASGLPVPPVYLLEDKSINAFAAGLKPEDAVIGVTRGCVELLSRDELQGVMAHEFSHILNGDMRINIKLIGILAGIMAIGIGGYYLMRVAFYSGATRSRSSKDSSPAAIAALGLALMIIGFVGVFFGNLIKAAISRQREYLADASAVQFTRNPDGIAGALKKIGGLSYGGLLRSANASEASHMYFGQGVPNYLGFLWATHPPLTQRILAIDPRWDGQFVEPKRPHRGREIDRHSNKRTEKDRRQQFGQILTTGVLVGAGANASTAKTPPTTNNLNARNFIDNVGALTEHHVEYARLLIDSIPEHLKTAARGSYGARAVVYALLLDGDTPVRSKQLTQLRTHADKAVAELTGKILDDVATLDPATRLPLLDIAIGSLKELSPTQYATFKENVRVLVNADQKIDLFEFMISRMLERHLDTLFNPPKRSRAYHYSLKPVIPECSILLSILAYVGQPDKSQAQQAFNQAAGDLLNSGLQLLPTEQCSMQALSAALKKLNLCAPRQKKQILTMCANCVASDAVVTLREAELLRAVADAMECPAAPLLAGQSAA